MFPACEPLPELKQLARLRSYAPVPPRRMDFPPLVSGCYARYSVADGRRVCLFEIESVALLRP